MQSSAAEEESDESDHHETPSERSTGAEKEKKKSIMSRIKSASQRVKTGLTRKQAVTRTSSEGSMNEGYQIDIDTDNESRVGSVTTLWSGTPLRSEDTENETLTQVSHRPCSHIYNLSGLVLKYISYLYFGLLGLLDKMSRGGWLLSAFSINSHY